MYGEHEETIAALSTPPGESGIAVIRMSGPNSLRLLSSILVCEEHRPSPDAWKHRRVYHGHLVDEKGEVLDEVVCTVWRGPESYTGEDTVEISCHGSALLVERILRLVWSKSARPAEPGEFTRRAFVNGKMDLIQAEAVADLIHARSELQQRVAQQQLAGELSRRIGLLADEMLGLLGTIEANIDFIEEGIDTLDVPSSRELIDSHRIGLGKLLANSSLVKPFHEGYRVAISGPVNAGKSRLFNRLLGESRAIVTEVPGTTRDVLREPMVIEGLLFILQDTAGIRGTLDRVETIGIEFARTAVGEADLIVFVVDRSERLGDETRERLRELDPNRSVVVLNKSDLHPEVSEDEVRALFDNGTVLHVSAETGDGIETLRGALIDCVGRERLKWIAEERVVLNARLVATLTRAREQLDTLDENIRTRAPLEILAVDAREVLQLYEAATGKRYTEDLLDNIFSRFCIGK